MNVTKLGFGFSITSPVVWMRFTDLFGFFSFWASVKEADVGGPGEGRDERYDTGNWIFSDQSSCLDGIN